jgi:[ribosomal protein S5]-alanine N-acetyltransferase
MTTEVLQTPRLALRHLEHADAPFVLELYNEPGWLRYIGDRGIRTLEDAQRHIAEGPAKMYVELGYGLYLVESRASGERLGICGILKRDTLPDVDLGFAFVERFCGRGYAYESAQAVISHASRHLGIRRIAAIASPDNHASERLLRKLGFALQPQLYRAKSGQDLSLYLLIRSSV